MADINLVVLARAANHPADDTSPAGGALASGPVEIDDSTVGEWLPKLLALGAGDLDDDAAVQYQVAYLYNGDTGESADSPRIYLTNGIAQLSSAGHLAIVSDSAVDDSTRHVRIWGEVDGLLVYEDVTLNGTTEVVSAQTFTRVFRLQLRQNSDGSLVTAEGNISVSKSEDSSVVGVFLAAADSPGISTLTAEYAFGVAAANGDVSTWANRRTAPGGISFGSYRSASNTLSLPADLGPEEYCAIYVRQTVQPGMPRQNCLLDFCFEIE